MARKHLAPGTVFDIFQFYSGWCSVHGIEHQASFLGRWEEHLLCVSCCVFVVGQTIQIVDKAYQNLSLDKLIRLELNLVGYSHLLGMARS